MGKSAGRARASPIHTLRLIRSAACATVEQLERRQLLSGLTAGFSK